MQFIVNLCSFVYDIHLLLSSKLRHRVCTAHLDGTVRRRYQYCTKV